MRIKRNFVLIAILTIIGVLLHFYNLNWGAPFYFHPDERNIASAVSQLQFPKQMNPHFFAYGSLPIYIIYITGYTFNSLTNLFNQNPYILHPTFEQAIQISRLYSALFATALIPILFFIGKKLKDEKTGLIAALLATTSVGFIQFSHFGTFEMWLTFFSVLLFWLCISLPKQLTKESILLLGLLTGTLVAIKISHLVIVPIVLLIIVIKQWQQQKKKLLSFFSRLISMLSLFFIAAFFIYYVTNPYVFLDTGSFQDTMEYESNLALGKLLVFYTAEFFTAIPVIFQFTHIYPFLLNPLLTILLLPSFAYIFFLIIKRKQFLFLLLASFFLILFLSQAFLFAKWTRYMVPTLPFIFLIVGIALADFIKNKHQQFNNITILTIVLINSIFALSYFITAFVRPDTRVAAYHFAQKIVPYDSLILSEVYDMGIVPFNDSYHMISLFNFYDLDNNSPEATTDILQQRLAQSDYIILPSQRLIKPRLMNKEKFPLGNAFYQRLADGSLGYHKIYVTPCDLFCKITYLGDPAFRFEQTANVFDRPTVMIFKKM